MKKQSGWSVDLGSRLWCAVLCVCAVALSGGCQLAGGMADSFYRTEEVDIAAEYRGLEGERVAVLVDAGFDIQYEHPAAVPVLTEMIAGGIGSGCEGCESLHPQIVLAYQANNVYWTTLPPEEIAAALRVTRLVLIEVDTYRLTPPGNSYLWDGRIVGTVRVIEADGVDPSTDAYSKRVGAMFPYEQAVGREQASESLIEYRLQGEFAMKVVRLFQDHVRTRGDIIDEERREARGDF